MEVNKPTKEEAWNPTQSDVWREEKEQQTLKEGFGEYE